VCVCVCVPRARSLFLFRLCLPSTSLARSPMHVFFIFLPLCPFLLPAPTGTYRTFLLPCSQWPATATLLPLVFPSIPHPSRSNRILDAFSSLLRAALLVPTWLRGTYYAYSCKLRSSDRREYGETTGGIISEHCLGEHPAVHAWIAWEENKACWVSASGNR